MAEEMVTIAKKEYDSLCVDAAHLSVLEMMGVDNWGGYVGPYNNCRKCDAEATWADESCPKCGGKLPEAWDLI